MHKKLMFSQTVMAASLMAAYGTAWSAAEDATVAELTQPSSEVSVGVGNWNRDRQQFGRFDGMRKKDSYLLLDADVRKRNETTGTWLNLKLNDLGTDNREIRAEYLEQGNQGASVEYTEFRANNPYTIKTNNQGIGTSYQYSTSNIPSTAIGSGTEYQLGTNRKKTAVSLYKNLALDLDFVAKFSSEKKTGNELTSSGKNGPNGNFNFVADLIDRTTNKAEATLNYNVGALQIDGGYYGSWFKNNTVGYVAYAGVAPALTSVAGSNIMTQPADNQSHQLFVDGSYRFSPTTKGTFKLAYARDTQNDSLPTAGIVGATFGNFSNLNGRVDTTLMQFGLTAKPMDKLSVVANLRYNNRDDKTPGVTNAPNTLTGASVAIVDRPSPRSYKTTTGKLEGTYRLPQGYAATAGIDYSVQHRTVITNLSSGAVYNPLVPDRSRLTEPTYRLQLRKTLDDALNGSVAYLQSYRKGSSYQPDTGTGTSTVSPLSQADRDRRKIRLAMDWTPMEKLGLQFVAENAQDDYGDSQRFQGVQDGKADLYSMDASYQLSADWQIAGWYSITSNKAHFNTTTTAFSFGAPPAGTQFIKEQKDKGEAFGVNLSGKINAKTKAGATLSWSQDNTGFIQSRSDGVATGAVAPNISSTATKIDLFAVYSIDKNADLRFDVGYQRWRSNDWQWTYQNGLPYQFGSTTAVDGTTVITLPAQSATFVGARYIYNFK